MSNDLNFPSAGNPANAPERANRTRERIPMSVPQLKLAVPDIPGYHLHWMMNEPARIAQALRAGYEFVERGQVEVSNNLLGGTAAEDGSTDLGSRISVVAGGVNEQGEAARLVLMMIKNEWWAEDQKAMESRSDLLVSQLRSGQINADQAGEQQTDKRHRYVDSARTRGTIFDKRRA